MDGLLEGDENFNLNLVNTSAATTATNVTIDEDATVETTTIVDDDDALFTLSQNNGVYDEIAEGSNASYTVSLDKDLDTGVTADVDLKITLPGGFGNAEIADFTAATLAALSDEIIAQDGSGVTVTFVTSDATSVTVNIAFDSTSNESFTFTLGTFDDRLFEGDEDFTLNLVNNSAAMNATDVTIDENAAVETTTITDNDEANGPPIADDDFIVTNIVDGSDIFITIVALLIKDSDPDGDSLVDFTIANTPAMQIHLDEIGCNVAAKAHAVVLMDRAGWHSTDKLKVPKNLTIILLPSRSPELNPVENIWQYLRQNWLSNRVFEDYDAIIEAGCQAWNKLIDQPETIMSIGMRDWAHTGQ